MTEPILVIARVKQVKTDGLVAKSFELEPLGEMYDNKAAEQARKETERLAD